MKPEILAAHRKWQEAEDKVPERDYQKGFKSRNARARKLYRVFAALCEAEGLNPTQTAVDLANPTRTLTLKA